MATCISSRFSAPLDRLVSLRPKGCSVRVHLRLDIAISGVLEKRKRRQKRTPRIYHSVSRANVYSGVVRRRPDVADGDVNAGLSLPSAPVSNSVTSRGPPASTSKNVTRRNAITKHLANIGNRATLTCFPFGRSVFVLPFARGVRVARCGSLVQQRLDCDQPRYVYLKVRGTKAWRRIDR